MKYKYFDLIYVKFNYISNNNCTFLGVKVHIEPFLGAVESHYKIEKNKKTHPIMQYRISFLIPFAVPIILRKLFQGIIYFLFLMSALYTAFYH